MTANELARTEARSYVRQLVGAYRAGHLGGDIMPEDAVVGVTDSDSMLDLLTLPMALNYQRNSYALWRAVRSAFEDDTTRWIFRPSQVVDAAEDELRDALLLHRVALQPTRHPQIWRRVSEGIVASSTEATVAAMLTSFDHDVATAIRQMQQVRKKEFPYLSGPKIFNYWLYVLESYGSIRWTSRDLITIAPDTHILQASVALGIASASVLDGSAQSRNDVAEAWRLLLDGSDLAPIDVHTPLWLWSRLGCPPLDSLDSSGQELS